MNEKRIKQIKELSEQLNLIDLKTFTKTYFKGNRSLARYHFNKYNAITISGSTFIIDPNKNI